ncbi:hypothetical protein F5Y12DRAFT_710226 [Xylaria sp. FL1777]|nr:hypothetical protein F5Y12DRAFT_710226 [Xylaria sp. FL1777]
MSFRPIRPLPKPQVDDGSDKRPVKTRTSTCDGSRPRCLVCVTRKKECVYRGEEGQSTADILKARIEELEQRVCELQAGQASRAPPAGLGEPGEPGEPGGSSAVNAIAKQTHSSVDLVVPSAPVTNSAIDGFFSCSGKLFHVFSEAQVSRIAESVYSEMDTESEDRRADIGSLMAVAAVGSQYANTVIEDKVRETFYNVAKFYLEDVITRRPLESIKVCTLLCMYNVFGKATVSLAYSDVGLGMCDRYGLHCQQRQLGGITDSTWIDYRKTWRTLVFLSTWLAASLGYKTGNYEVLQRVVSSSQLQTDMVQIEMTKIAVLKAKILHMHLAFKYLAAEPLNSMIQDLQDWYEQLPPQMQLQNLSGRDVTHEVRRSIYHVHLLYLGANMLLFRRIVAENIKVRRRRDINLSPLWQMSSDLLSKQGPIALGAANMSARILKLLLDENGIFQRCWLVIFQSYTSCIIILHAVLRNLVSSLVHSYKDEMENARLCLVTLAYCGSADPVADRFHEKAQAIYNSVLKHIENHPEALKNLRRQTTDTEDLSSSTNTPKDSSSGRSQEDNSMQLDSDDTAALPSYHRSIEELSFDLSMMLCRPFGDPSCREGTKESIAVTNKSDPSRYEHAVLMERLDWDFENSIPFQWDSNMLGFGGLGSGVSGEGSSQNPQSGNRFLDSMHPSGWT